MSENSDGGMFIVGFVFGFIICVVFTCMFLMSEPNVIQTKKKIVPEWELVTDGKVVDTLYIYKNK